MSRTVLIALLLAVAGLSTAPIVSGGPAVSEEQRATRPKFLGSDKDLPPIKNGQEMRPRW